MEINSARFFSFNCSGVNSFEIVSLRCTAPFRRIGVGRFFFLTVVGRQLSSDLSEVSRIAHVGDKHSPGAVHDLRAAIETTGLLRTIRLGARLRLLAHRPGFACHQRLIDVQFHRFHDSAVGRYFIAGLQVHRVADHYFFKTDGVKGSVAQHFDCATRPCGR